MEDEAHGLGWRGRAGRLLGNQYQSEVRNEFDLQSILLIFLFFLLGDQAPNFLQGSRRATQSVQGGCWWGVDWIAEVVFFPEMLATA